MVADTLADADVGERHDGGAGIDVDIDVDVAIVGDGLVGRPLALALVARGWHVALIDRLQGARSTASAGLDGSRDPLRERCTAISIATRDWLEREGLWDAGAARAESIRSVRVSHRGFFGATRLDADELGERALGATIENTALVASLQPLLDGHAAAGRIVHLEGMAPRGTTLRAGRRCLALENGAGEVATGVRARLLVAADGADSRTRELLGIDTRRHDYAQSAVLGTVRLDRDHGGVAIERFTADGPLALLPRPGRHMNLVACADPQRAAMLQGLSDAGWLAELSRLAPGRLGRFVATGPRTVVPLVRIEAQRTHAGRALLLGNAARLLHPVAGQGYNLALRDVAALVRHLDRAAGTDPGAQGEIDAFERARRADRQRTVRLTDALARTFRGTFAPLGHARAGGLIALDAIGPARRAFARVAMGRKVA